MKYTLTIDTDDPRDILALFARRETAPAATIGDSPIPPTATREPPDDDADNGEPDANAPDTDARGFIWDERIHASSKALNKDGTWRYKRNTPDDVIKKVEAELKPWPGHTPMAPQDPPTVPTVPTSEALAPVVPPVPTGQPAPCAPDAQPAGVTYEMIVARLTDLMQDGRLPPAKMPEYFAKWGVSSAPELNGNQAALDAAYADLALL